MVMVMVIMLIPSTISHTIAGTTVIQYISYTTSLNGGYIPSNPKPLTPNGGSWYGDSNTSINYYGWRWQSGAISTLYNAVNVTNNYQSSMSVRYAASGTTFEVVSDGYAPEAGAYRWIVLGCNQNICNKQNMIKYTPAPYIANLVTTTPISKQYTPHGDPFGIQLATPRGAAALNSICYALEHISTGKLYGTGKPWSCSDGQPLGSAVSCTINGGQPLDVFLGDSIDRTQIGTQPGGYGVTTTNVNVNCTGPAGSRLTASAALNFTPVAGSGDAHISTSNPGLGVVTKLGGNVMTNTTGAPVNLIPGSNQLQMDFTPVRLDTTPIESIATGPLAHPHHSF